MKYLSHLIYAVSLGGLLINISCKAQQENSKTQKYFIFSGTNKELIMDMEDKGFGRIHIIYARDIDPDWDGQFNREVFIDQIRKLFPRKHDQGILALDWEREKSKIIRKEDIHSQRFKNAIAEMVALLDLVHKIRPNVLVGYYGLPIRRRTKFDKEYLKRSLALRPIFKASNVIFPSLYDMGKGNPKMTNRDGARYIKNNVVFSLTLAKKYDCKVIPFVWHRFYPTVRKVGMELIPRKEFETSIKDILKANYNGNYVDGIVWWRSDNLFYRRKRKKIVEDARRRGGLIESLEANTLEYSKAFRKAFEYNTGTDSIQKFKE